MPHLYFDVYIVLGILPFHLNLYLKVEDIEWFRHLEMQLKELYHKVLADKSRMSPVGRGCLLGLELLYV